MENTEVIQDQIEEVPVEENLENHEESDAEKWDKVFADIEALRGQVNEAFKIIDDHRRWMEDFINGTGGSLKDESEDLETTEEEELDDMDAKFYEAQKEYSYGGY